MSRVVRWCLKNKSVVILATVLLVGSGIFATTRLNQELFPDIAFPVITIATPVPGAGPELVDEQVTQPVESAVNSVEGIESVQSSSAQGFSLVAVEFSLETDTEEAEADIQDSLADLELPEQAGDPNVRRQSAAEFPILTLSLAAGDEDIAALTTYAEDEAVPRLEEVEGVQSANLVGGSAAQLDVEVDPEALKENNLPPEAVVGAISGGGVNAPVGAVQVDGLSTPVRVASDLAADPESLEQLPVGIGAAAAAAGAPKGGGPPGGAPGGAAGGSAAAALAAAAPSEPVTLGDIATVRESGADSAGVSRTDAEPSVGINIVKAQDANTVEVAEGVEEALDEIRADLGEDEVRVVLDSAADVEQSVSGLVEEGVIGAFLAIVVIFAFLRSLRATLVTAVSLPTSVLAALLFSWGYDLTLNILTLAGLTIAVGRVVDDAIVVLENSYRYVQAGYDPEEAALKGTTEVASAITSSTLTTTAVFVPLGVVGGLISKFFVPLSLTVALALLASLIVSVTIIPVLVSIFLGRTTGRRDEEEEVAGEEGSGELAGSRRERRMENGRRGLGFWVVVGVVVFLIGVLGGIAGIVVASLLGLVDVDLGSLGDSAAFSLLIAAVLAVTLISGLAALLVRAARGESATPSRERGRGEAGEGPGGEEAGSLVQIYDPMLRWSLSHRLAVSLLALFLFLGGVVTAFFLPTSFFPPSQENILIAEAELPVGSSLQTTSDALEPFEDFLLDDSAVESYQVSIGGENELDLNPVRPNNQAQAFITLEEGDNAEEPSDVLERIEEEGVALFGEEDFQVQILSNGPPQGELQVVITGGTDAELEEAANLVTEEVSQNESIINVRSDLSESTQEVSVTVDPESASASGVSATQVASSLGVLVGGGAQTSLGDTPVSVGVPEGAADSVEEVEALPIGVGAEVGDVADVAEEEAPASITRSDGERAVTVSGRITSSDTAAVSAEVETAVTDLELPEGVTASVGGESEDIDEGFQRLFLSIIVALVLVYLILVLFFSSLLVPLIILLAVPLTTVGAFGTLFLTNTALSLPSLLGLLLLIGIVVSNAILLVDFAIKARDEYETVDEAVIAAGRARLRPILMTALATVFALLPLALGISGGGSQLVSSSLAITVIGGLLTSTFLTLLVVPVGFSLLAGARRKKKGR